MNLEQIHKEKINTIDEAIALAYNHLFKDLDKDRRFELADDEMNELIIDLFKYNLNQNI